MQSGEGSWSEDATDLVGLLGVRTMPLSLLCECAASEYSVGSHQIQGRKVGRRPGAGESARASVGPKRRLTLLSIFDSQRPTFPVSDVRHIPPLSPPLSLGRMVTWPTSSPT